MTRSVGRTLAFTFYRCRLITRQHDRYSRNGLSVNRQVYDSDARRRERDDADGEGASLRRDNEQVTNDDYGQL